MNATDHIDPVLEMIALYHYIYALPFPTANKNNPPVVMNSFIIRTLYENLFAPGKHPPHIQSNIRTEE